MRKTVLRRGAALFLTAVLLLSFFVFPASASGAELSRTAIGREDHAFVELPGFVKPAEPIINGKSAILVELNTGTILYAKNMNQRMYPASTTKVMTALLALENLSLDDTLTISYNATHDLIDGGFDWRFKEGQVFTIQEALYGLCLNSVNTLGYALAEKMAGSVSAFASMMNARAAELGALNTAFTNPHGLNDPNHLTTAYDMAKILWGAIEIDDYRRIAGTEYYNCPELKDGQIMNFTHTLSFLHPDNKWYDSRVVCGKTGWTEDASFCRAVYATDGKLDLICVVFYSSGENGDRVEQDVESLLDYGFQNYTLIGVPDFGEGTVLQGKIRNQNGEMQSIEFTTGEGRSLTGGSRLLVPNPYAEMNWRLDLALSGEELKGYASLGGVPLVEYPLSLKLPEESTTNNYFPTALPNTSIQQDTTRNETVPGSSNTTDPTETLPDDSSANGQSGSSAENQNKDGKLSGNILLLALIVCGAFFVLCLIGLLFTIGQNRRLRKRVDRRNALKKDS